MQKDKAVRIDQNYDALYKRLLTLYWDFYQRFGKPPQGFIVGPNEWLILKEAAADYPVQYDNTDFSIQLIYGGPTICKFMGLPIHVKTTNGVELAINSNMAALFVYDHEDIKTGRTNEHI